MMPNMVLKKQFEELSYIPVQPYKPGTTHSLWLNSQRRFTVTPRCTLNHGLAFWRGMSRVLCTFTRGKSSTRAHSRFVQASSCFERRHKYMSKCAQYFVRTVLKS